ncbi:tetratricopeptide repeat protein [bacterium]|nr:tetratricopeptide repeat protein [bacterium]
MSQHRFFSSLLLAALFSMSFLSSASAQTDRIALVTEVSGDVALAKAGTSAFTKVDWGTPLFEGDRIRTAASSEAVVLFSNSNMLTISAGNTFTVSAASVSSPALSGPVRAVDGELMAAASDLTLHRAGQGEIEVLGGLRSGGSSSDIEVTFPRNSKITSSRPHFSWTSAGDFEEFKVIVRSNEGEIWSEMTTETEMDYPASAPELVPGQTYFWQVEGEDMLDVATSPLVTFEVLSAEGLATIENGKAQITALFDGAKSSSGQLYMIGSMYVKQGLIADAITTFKQISESNPSAAMPHEILGKLYYEIGLKDEAVRSLQTAIALK